MKLCPWVLKKKVDSRVNDGDFSDSTVDQNPPPMQNAGDLGLIPGQDDPLKK